MNGGVGGGAAFPGSGEGAPEGMSIRTYLVAALLQGQVAYEGMEECDKERWVNCAIEVADEAIKQLHAEESL